jgi:CDP-diacylglycerol--glycerol-3-phosphate 3-phosphatidyltransferase
VPEQLTWIGTTDEEKSGSPAAHDSGVEAMANLITVLRTLLAFLAVAMLRWHTWEIYVGAALLTLLLIWMDAWDGWVARRRNEESKAGAVFDILGDRVVEMTYWIAFASFGWIPVWVAVLVSARGILVDGLRALAFERGLTAFGATSMMRSPIGRLLVTSRLSRGAYGLGKAAAFTLVILAFAPGWQPSLKTTLLVLAYGCVYVTVALCVVRGIPVLLEARRFLTPERAG